MPFLQFLFAVKKKVCVTIAMRKAKKKEVNKMKALRKTAILILTLIIISTGALSAGAAQHRVVYGDSMWRISRSYGVSLQSLIDANPQIKNPSLIYPGDLIYVPDNAAGAVLAATNRYRAQNGIRALNLDGELCRVAQAKADDMAAKGYFSHTSPTYGTPSEMLKSFGVAYNYMGENIAKGYTDADSVLKAWMGSEGHKRNILNASFTKLGVGYNAKQNIWVQIFVG